MQPQLSGIRPPRQLWIGFFLFWMTLEILQLFHDIAQYSYLALGVITIATAIVYIHRYRPPNRWAWRCLTIALILFAIGSIFRQLFDSFGNLNSDRPWLPTVVSLLGYIFLAAALLGILKVQSQSTTHYRGILFDAALSTVIVFSFEFLYIILPLQHGSPSLAATITLSLYPTLSACLLFITLRIEILTSKSHTAADTALLIAMLLMFAGDTLYMLAEIHKLQIPEILLNLPYSLSLFAVILLVSHPSMRTLTSQALGTKDASPLIAIAAVTSTILVTPFLVFEDMTRDHDRPFLIAILAIIAILIFIRIVLAVNEADRNQRQLMYQSDHDYLTGLGNRRLLEKHINYLIQQSTINSSTTPIAILFIDLDNFKILNDTLGHAAGDKYLIDIAARLRADLRAEDFVARIGGDEFVVIIENPSELAQIDLVSQRVKSSLETPITLKDFNYRLSASIGVEITEVSATSDLDTLIQNSDTAMYEAKLSRRGQVTFFDTATRKRIAFQSLLEKDLSRALERDQLHLLYQPIVDVRSNSILSIEALLRWSHPSFGEIAPGDFIHLAEKSGFIVDIGAWVIKHAMHEAAELRKQSEALRSTSININVSMEQLLRTHETPGLLYNTLVATGLPGNAVCIEITESAFMRDRMSVSQQVAELREMGLRVALDDFGTEYSSLIYLKSFPVDSLKIDRSFIVDLGNHVSVSDSLVSAIILMANGLGINVVAEGVESREQLNRLTELGCNLIQGYFYSRPLTVEKLITLADNVSTALN